METSSATAVLMESIVGPNHPIRHNVVMPKRFGAADLLIVVPVLLRSIYYYVGTPLGVALITTQHPVRAELLRGSLPSLVYAGAAAKVGTVALLVALLAPLPILTVTDPCFYWAGRRYGRMILARIGASNPRWDRALAKGERIFSRHAGLAVFFASVLWLPNEVIYFLAGETRMRFWRFLLLDLAGTLVWIGELVGLGYIIGQPAVNVVKALTPYAIWVVIATILIVVAITMPGAIRQAVEQARTAQEAEPGEDA